MPIELTVQLTVEEIDRLLQAISDGKLKEFGILDVRMPDSANPDASKQIWVATEDERREKPRNRDREPRP
jgi:hypothetical protein